MDLHYIKLAFLDVGDLLQKIGKSILPGTGPKV